MQKFMFRFVLLRVIRGEKILCMPQNSKCERSEMIETGPRS